MQVADRARLVFEFWLTFAGDRTPRRGGRVGMKPEPLTIELDDSVGTLAVEPKRAAAALDLAETRFVERVRASFPEHDLSSWDAHLGSAEGPVISRYWSGFFASE